MKYIHFTGNLNSCNQSQKAVSFTYAGGYTSIRDEYIWIPKSQIRASKPNEFGNQDIYIKAWIFQKNRRDPSRIRDLNYYGAVDNPYDKMIVKHEGVES